MKVKAKKMVKWPIQQRPDQLFLFIQILPRSSQLALFNKHSSLINPSVELSPKVKSYERQR